MIIAIDGPAGAGKSTTARAVAAHFGFATIDTGAMYRAVALVATEKALRVGEDDDAITALARDLPLRFEGNGERIFIGARDVSAAIRTPQIGALTSAISAIPALRAIIVEMQRRLAREAECTCGGAVLEGRDIQTVVFPDAPVKIFLTADAATRAGRRVAQWSASDTRSLLDAQTLNDIARDSAGRDSAEQENAALAENAERDIRERDERDSTRAASPLRAAPDAVHISTDVLSPEEVVARIAEIVEAKRKASSGAKQ